MESKINQVVKLETGDKYVILKQAVYKNENYYIASKLDKDDKPLADELMFFHEILFDDKLKFEEVGDTELIKYLYSYMQF